MIKRKQHVASLRLSRESVKRLSPAELTQAGGGSHLGGTDHGSEQTVCGCGYTYTCPRATY
jgi:hypothetical protein